jgi:hypothetical protein
VNLREVRHRRLESNAVTGPGDLNDRSTRQSPLRVSGNPVFIAIASHGCAREALLPLDVGKVHLASDNG